MKSEISDITQALAATTLNDYDDDEPQTIVHIVPLDESDLEDYVHTCFHAVYGDNAVSEEHLHRKNLFSLKLNGTIHYVHGDEIFSREDVTHVAQYLARICVVKETTKAKCSVRGKVYEATDFKVTDTCHHIETVFFLSLIMNHIDVMPECFDKFASWRSKAWICDLYDKCQWCGTTTSAKTCSKHCNYAIYRQYSPIHQLSNRVSNYRKTDKKRGKEAAITLETVLMKILRTLGYDVRMLTLQGLKQLWVECIVSGVQLTCALCDKPIHWTELSLDRIDNDTGHDLDNIQFTHWKCNHLRGAKSMEQYRGIEQIF